MRCAFLDRVGSEEKREEDKRGGSIRYAFALFSSEYIYQIGPESDPLNISMRSRGGYLHFAGTEFSYLPFYFSIHHG